MTPEANAYLRSLKRVERIALCRRAEISLQWLLNLTYDKRKPSPAVAVSLERATGGKVTREALRPDIDWKLVGDYDPRKVGETKQKNR